MNSSSSSVLSLCHLPCSQLQFENTKWIIVELNISYVYSSVIFTWIMKPCNIPLCPIWKENFCSFWHIHTLKILYSFHLSSCSSNVSHTVNYCGFAVLAERSSLLDWINDKHSQSIRAETLAALLHYTIIIIIFLCLVYWINIVTDMQLQEKMHSVSYYLHFHLWFGCHENYLPGVS